MNQELFQQGLSQYQAGDFEAARDTFLQFTTAFSDHSEGWLNAGNAAFKLEALDEAEKYWLKAATLNPMEATAYLNLGNLYFKKNLVHKAIQNWEVFKKLKPGHPHVWLNLGIAYEQLDEMEKAIESYKEYMSLESGSRETIKLQVRFEASQETAESLIKKADRALQASERDQAMDAFGQAVAIWPATTRVYKTYASLLYQEKQYNAALENYFHAYRRSPGDATILINIGVIYEQKNRNFDAIWAYHKALSLKDVAQREKLQHRLDVLLETYGKRFDEYVREAGDLLSEGKLEEADMMLLRVRELATYCQSEQVAVKSLLAKIEDIRNPLVKASKTYYSLGENAREQGRYDQALRFYGQYLEVAPKGDHAAEVRQKIEALKSTMGAIVGSMLEGGMIDLMSGLKSEPAVPEKKDPNAF